MKIEIRVKKNYDSTEQARQGTTNLETIVRARICSEFAASSRGFLGGLVPRPQRARQATATESLDVVATIGSANIQLMET